MAKYETLKSKEIQYGSNSFLEVALKEVVGEDGNPSRFISLSKGWIPKEAEEPNARRFRSGIGFPAEKELIEEFAKALQDIASQAESAPRPEPKQEETSSEESESEDASSEEASAEESEDSSEAEEATAESADDSSEEKPEEQA